MRRAVQREDNDIDPGRRQLLLNALCSLGALWLPTGLVEAVEAIGSRSIYLLRGAVKINGQTPTLETRIWGSDLIETGADGQIVFRVESDAFILRPNSRLQLSPPPADNALIEGLRLITGGVLSVFAKRRHRIYTPNAVVGIRGTGVYCEVEPDRDYICTCYGVTEISANDDPSIRDVVDAGHHESRYVLAPGASGKRMQKGGFKNHTDDELVLIESLVGRTPAFRGAIDGYDRPRRQQY